MSVMYWIEFAFQATQWMAFLCGDYGLFTMMFLISAIPTLCSKGLAGFPSFLQSRYNFFRDIVMFLIQMHEKNNEEQAREEMRILRERQFQSQQIHQRKTRSINWQQIRRQNGLNNENGTRPVKCIVDNSQKRRTPEKPPREILGLDCEMVGIGPKGLKSALARVSVVDIHGRVVYDSYVRCTAPVTDYRTFVSGIEPHHLENAPVFTHVQHCVQKLISRAILVGHGLENDLKILRLNHPAHMIRDTAFYTPIRRVIGYSRAPPLKLLVNEILGEEFQDGQHDSVADAYAPIRLYLRFREQWENDALNM